MKITVFDIASIGTDIDLSPITSLGECEVFEATSADEVIPRIADTEIAVLNKVKMTAEVLEKAFRDRPELKTLFEAADKATAEDVLRTVKILNTFIEDYDD